MSNVFYFQNGSVSSLKRIVTNELSPLIEHKPPEQASKKELREALFKIFQSDTFVRAYIDLAMAVGKRIGIPYDRLVVQTKPTPRIFMPNDFGTSLHCDYWYGHGDSFYTIWFPITGIAEGSTFNAIFDSEKNEIAHQLISFKSGTMMVDENIYKIFDPVLPSEGQCAVFNSRILHESPLNSSQQMRISFDFRIGDIGDRTSTKNISEYYRWNGEKYSCDEPRFLNKFIKYIHGGKGISTLAQHLLIEAYAREKNINIVGQEAEIERFGTPMLRFHAEKISRRLVEYNSIILATKSLLSVDDILTLKSSNINAFCCLEDEWV